jgi:REP element-mobilizing transposase RayT
MSDATTEVVRTFRWDVHGWSSLTEASLLSEEFEAGGDSWRIGLFPRGDPGRNSSGYVSMYLELGSHKTLPDNWKKHVTFTLTIEGAKKHDDENAAAVSARAVRQRFGNTFTKDRGWGCSNFVSLTTLNDPDEGLVSRGDTVVITAGVSVMDKTQEGVLVYCHDAAARGNLDVLKYLRETMNTPWDVATCAAAAWIGNLEILKWARENGCPWDKRTCDNAARNGHLELLKWARENGAPWDDETCASALKGKHFNVVKYYVEERERALEVFDFTPGLPWDKRTCENAAQNGNLKLLKWARKNGAPWDDETCASALKGKHFEVVKYYVEERERALEVTDVIPGLLNEVVIKHVLKPDHLLTAADLARLRAVSPVMRDAVDATGRVLRSDKK